VGIQAYAICIGGYTSLRFIGDIEWGRNLKLGIPSPRRPLPRKQEEAGLECGSTPTKALRTPRALRLKPKVFSSKSGAQGGEGELRTALTESQSAEPLPGFVGRGCSPPARLSAPGLSASCQAL
jgi:hypothetical protein